MKLTNRETGLTYDMTTTKSEWLKGSLASWMLVVMLPIIGYLVARVVQQNEVDHVRMQAQIESRYLAVDVNGNRITRLESQIISGAETMARIERKLDNIEVIIRSGKP